MHPREIVMRWQAHYSLRKTVEEHWQLIERFVCPGRGKFFQEEKSEHELTWRRRELYDSTAPMAGQKEYQHSLLMPGVLHPRRATLVLA